MVVVAGSSPVVATICAPKCYNLKQIPAARSFFRDSLLRRKTAQFATFLRFSPELLLLIFPKITALFKGDLPRIAIILKE